MKNSLLLFTLTNLLIFVISSSIVAQDAFEKYQKETIYLQGHFYVKNGDIYPRGFLNNKLKQELEISPNAMKEFQKYEVARNKAFIFYGLGLGGLISSTLIDKKKEGLKTGLSIGGAGLLTVSFIFGVKSNNSFMKSIWIRNGDLLR